MPEALGRIVRYLVVVSFVALVGMFLLSLIFPPPAPATQISFDEYAAFVEKEAVAKTEVQSGSGLSYRVDVALNDTSRHFFYKGALQDLEAILAGPPYQLPREKIAAAYITMMPSSDDNAWIGIVVTGILPLILIGGFILFMMKQAQGANNAAISFGKSRARMSLQRKDVTFADVGGLGEETKQELTEYVDFLKEPDKYRVLGARIPRGLLLVGHPGTGKTLVARAIAGEAGGIPFFTISGSEFVEMFVGVGASRVRDLFNQARRNAPAIVFVDEIDAVGRQRGAGLGGSHDEREQTLNQILVEMDGFDTNSTVVVVAATNRPDILDAALLRPGRFDRQVVLHRPDKKGRKQILDIHVSGKPFHRDVDFEKLAQETPGFTGADLANLMNEAAIHAARRGAKEIWQIDFTTALEKIVMGTATSRLISGDEKLVIAYHEGGHAIVGAALPYCDPVRKVTVIGRGMALGYTLALPEEDTNLKTKEELEDQIAALLGGRAAEELAFTDVTSGASNDLEMATGLARRIVMEFGMSEKLGPLVWGSSQELVFLGREIGEQRNYSDEIAALIDSEVKAIVEKARERARGTLQAHRGKLDAMAEALVTHETLEGDELTQMFEGFPAKSRGVGIMRE